MPNECRVVFSSLAAVVLGVACTPAEPPGRAGQVTLAYEGLRNDGMTVSKLFFSLENRSTRTLSFRGEKAFGSSTAAPVYTALNCSDPHRPEAMGYSAFPLIDFDGEPPPFLEVSPGEHLRLDVRDPGHEIAQHKGGVCVLRLQLKDKVVIESKPFRPVIAF
jgi:hypothetical protein